MSDSLIFISGLNCTARLWRHQVESLRHKVNITIADNASHDTISETAKEILKKAPSKFALAGLSMGGYLAFEILRHAPERVEKLALLNTQARADSEESRNKRLQQIKLAQSGRFSEIPPLQYPAFVHPSRLQDEALRASVMAMATETGAEAFIRQQQIIMSRPDSVSLLSSIACPTMIIGGDGDQLTPPPLAQEMASGISGSELKIIPNCGHLSPLEQPERVTKYLEEWLAK